LDKLAKVLTSPTQSFSSVAKGKRIRTAEIVTGLYLLTNPQYRTMLNIDDAMFQLIKTQLVTNPTAVKLTTQAGRRLPSKLQSFQSSLERYTKMSPTSQRLFLTQLKSIHDKLKA
jgi:hypothetical protein